MPDPEHATGLCTRLFQRRYRKVAEQPGEAIKASV